jgi:prepilin-type processing-associated H-X9-DG protein/prepilin-type N-terminal cleavage/methylation domain-containing protein
MCQIYCQDSRMMQKEVQVESRVRENFMHGLVGEVKQTGRSMCRGRFTLIELLVVIAIIAILASMLLPALKLARDKGKSLVCLSNEKQMYLAFQMYLNSYNGWWFDPTGSDIDLARWPAILINEGYAKQGRCIYDTNLHCPSRISPGPNPYNWATLEHDNFTDYGLCATDYWAGGGLRGVYSNESGCKANQIKNPSNFIVLCERWDKNIKTKNTTFFEDRRFWPGGGLTTYLHPWMHNRSSNYLFADGHVEDILAKNLRLKLFMLGTNLPYYNTNKDVQPVYPW